MKNDEEWPPSPRAATEEKTERISVGAGADRAKTGIKNDEMISEPHADAYRRWRGSRQAWPFGSMKNDEEWPPSPRAATEEKKKWISVGAGADRAKTEQDKNDFRTAQAIARSGLCLSGTLATHYDCNHMYSIVFFIKR